MKHESLFKVFVVMVLLASASYGVETIVSSSQFGTNWGVQPTWGGGTGLWFTMGDTARTVHKLGFIDLENVTNGGKTPDGLVRNHTILLYDWTNMDAGYTNPPVAEVNVPAGTAGELIDGFRYADLDTPYTLQPNTQYLILGSPGEGTSTGDRYINPNTLTPNSYFIGSTTDPNNWARGHFNPWNSLPGISYVVGSAYGSVNMATPEPMTIALLGAGAVLMRRRKRI